MADAPLTLRDLAASDHSPWLRSVRLTAYLLRSLASRARKALEGDEYRRSNLPEELAAAVRGEHRDGMWPESWLDRLAERWGVSLAGSADDPFPLCAWLPEGRVPWLTACRVIRRTDLAALVSEWGSFLATFATSPTSEDDDDILRVDLPPEIGDPWRAPIPAGAIRPHEWTAVWTFTAPMHHGADEKDGNVSRFRTERRYSPILGRFVETPIYTGNAFRGQCRDLVALDLFDAIGLRPNEALPVWAHSLFSGGSIESGSASNGSNAAFRRELRDLLPIVDLLGGVYNNEPMDGVLRASDALPICRETADAVAWRVVPDVAEQGHDAIAAWSERLPWAEDLYETRQLTRHAHRDIEGDGGQMLVRTQVIKAGVQWVHSVTLAAKDRLLSPLTASALAHMLDLFVRSGAVGAGNARGLGAFVTDGYGNVAYPAAYREHVAAKADDIRAVLMGARTLGPGRPPPAEKPSKGKKPAKGGKASEIDAPDEAAP